MRELEERIINSVFGEDQYRKVSFLEPEDFTNYPGYPYKEYFKLIKKTNAKEDTLMECLINSENKELKGLLSDQSNLLGYNYPERSALKLLEIRFKGLFINLLVKLSSESKNSVERELLNESNLMVIKSDIFDLSDHILEYLGVHANVHTKARIKSFLQYRDKRVNEARKVINAI